MNRERSERFIIYSREILKGILKIYSKGFIRRLLLSTVYPLYTTVYLLFNIAHPLFIMMTSSTLANDAGTIVFTMVLAAPMIRFLLTRSPVSVEDGGRNP
jgi:hypothetical protein